MNRNILSFNRIISSLNRNISYFYRIISYLDRNVSCFYRIISYLDRNVSCFYRIISYLDRIILFFGRNRGKYHRRRAKPSRQTGQPQGLPLHTQIATHPNDVIATQCRGDPCGRPFATMVTKSAIDVTANAVNAHLPHSPRRLSYSATPIRNETPHILQKSWRNCEHRCTGANITADTGKHHGKRGEHRCTGAKINSKWADTQVCPYKRGCDNRPSG